MSKAVRTPTEVARCGCPYDPEYDEGSLGWHLRENHPPLVHELRERVIQEARRLVAKIKADEARGTPVHPAGHSDCRWTLDGGGYPAEYAALARALDELDRSEPWPA